MAPAVAARTLALSAEMPCMICGWAAWPIRPSAEPAAQPGAQDVRARAGEHRDGRGRQAQLSRGLELKERRLVGERYRVRDHAYARTVGERVGAASIHLACLPLTLVHLTILKAALTDAFALAGGVQIPCVHVSRFFTESLPLALFCPSVRLWRARGWRHRRATDEDEHRRPHRPLVSSDRFRESVRVDNERPH